MIITTAVRVIHVVEITVSSRARSHALACTHVRTLPTLAPRTHARTHARTDQLPLVGGDVDLLADLLDQRLLVLGHAVQPTPVRDGLHALIVFVAEQRALLAVVAARRVRVRGVVTRGGARVMMIGAE